MRKLLRLFFLFAAAFGLFLLAVSCRLYNLEKKLDPVNAEFLSKVRYIITGEERKIFLELPGSEKAKFIEEFWKRRDPDPYTEENEFKTEYFDRIEKVNELFVGEGRPGWLTDRGRIYILFGPPTDRITSPTGGFSGGRCDEVWYYGIYPILFVDSTCSGTYALVTLNLEQLHDLNIAESRAQKFKKEKEFFDFSVSVKKTAVTEEKAEGLFILDIPYQGIWFGAEGEKLGTILEVKLDVRDVQNALVWEYKRDHEIKITEAELRASMKKKFTIEIPFVLTKELAKLRQGQAKANVSIKNKTGSEELRKVFDFNL